MNIGSPISALPPHAFDTSKSRRPVTIAPSVLHASRRWSALACEILNTRSGPASGKSTSPAEYHLKISDTSSFGSAMKPSSDIVNPAMILPMRNAPFGTARLRREDLEQTRRQRGGRDVVILTFEHLMPRIGEL